jgi:hypothetical protein
MTRAAISGAPPAGIGTISLIGRDGYWASAPALASANTQAANRRSNLAIITHFFAYHPEMQRHTRYR